MSSRIKRIVISVCTLLLIFYVGCKNNSEPDSFDYSITSPKEGWSYSTGRSVLLTTNLNSDGIYWSSSLDGELGQGNNLTTYLSAGNHTISAEYEGCKKSVYITINEKEAKLGETNKTLITKLPFEKLYSEGSYLPYLVSGDAEIKGISVTL